jgi:hypothetical protein
MSCIVNAVTIRSLVEHPVAADSVAFFVANYVVKTGRSKIFQSRQPTGASAYNTDTAVFLFAGSHAQ